MELVYGSNWSKSYERCLKCETNEVKHCAFGLCLKCYKSDYNKKHKFECSICNEINPISTRENGKIICKLCRRKYFFKITPKKCSICHRVKRVDKIENGKNICSGCYKKYCREPIIDTCSICDNLRPRMLFKDNKSICGYCYRKYFYVKKKKICDKCGELNYPCQKISENETICNTCYKRKRKLYYRALEHNRKINGSITSDEFKEIEQRDKVCVYCSSDKDLCFDHIIPLSRGGKSEFDNYVLACKKCNTSKRDRDVFEWCKIKGIEIPKIILKN